MRLVVKGRSAARDRRTSSSISVHTARNHIAHIYEKLGVRNRRRGGRGSALRASLDGCGARSCG